MNPDSQTAPAPAPVDQLRRGLLYAGCGVAAALAGAGYAWRSLEPAGVPREGAVEAFWDMRFETPAGGELAMQSFRGTTLLINFWATWCPPCVEELPLIDAFYKANKGNNWEVVALAIDQPSAVRQFLRRLPLSFAVGLAGLGGTELGKSLGNLSGGLPFTVVMAPSGAVLQRRMGKLTATELAQWAAAS